MTEICYTLPDTIEILIFMKRKIINLHLTIYYLEKSNEIFTR